jgi:hypothetical protein
VKQQLYLNRPRRASSMQLEQAEKPTLDNVMGNPRGFKALEDFLKLEFSVRALLAVPLALPLIFFVCCCHRSRICCLFATPPRSSGSPR